jgi:hypothetical protein
MRNPSASRPDVFISYAREDKKTATALATRLEAEGLVVWYDVNIAGGSSFADQIDLVVRSARSAIVLWSQLSVASKWVRAEADIAFHRNVLIPVVISNCTVKLPFNILQSIDFRYWDERSDHASFQALLASLRETIAKERAAGLAGSPIGRALQKLYGQRFEVVSRSGLQVTVEIPQRAALQAGWPKVGMEAYTIPCYARIGAMALPCVLKLFKSSVPQRQKRTEFLIDLGTLVSSDTRFAALPFLWIEPTEMDGITVSGHLSRLFGNQGSEASLPLQELIESGVLESLGRPSLARLGMEIAQIVYDLEDMAIVHGDLSPNSIMVAGWDHLTPVCRLIDFDGYSAPGAEDLPRRHDGQFVRPLGTLGYQSPDLILKIMHDPAGGDTSIRVETDRFSLAALICQIMVWDTAFAHAHRRWELLTNDVIVKRAVDEMKSFFEARFPEGLEFMSRALLAKTMDEMPAPRDWIERLSHIAEN